MPKRSSSSCSSGSFGRVLCRPVSDPPLLATSLLSTYSFSTSMPAAAAVSSHSCDTPLGLCCSAVHSAALACASAASKGTTSTAAVVVAAVAAAGVVSVLLVCSVCSAWHSIAHTTKAS
eukprot:15666-Heterococcus_DN1.PRE.2